MNYYIFCSKCRHTQPLRSMRNTILCKCPGKNRINVPIKDIFFYYTNCNESFKFRMCHEETCKIKGRAKYYCVECRKFICSKLEVAHQGHKFIPLKCLISVEEIEKGPVLTKRVIEPSTNFRNKKEVLKTKTLLWLDALADGLYNSETLDIYKKELQEFNIIKVTNIEDAFNFLLSVKFELIYLIVSESVCQDFVNIFQKEAKHLNCVTAMIIYCLKKDSLEKEKFIGDSFLNPGGLASEFKEVMDFFLRDDFGWAQVLNYPMLPSLTSGEENSLITIGFLDSLENITYSTILSKILGNREISTESMIEFFQRIFKYGRKNLSELAKPSKEKDLGFPFYFYSKFYLRLLSLDSPFIKDINKDLSNGNYEPYKTFISILYSAIKTRAVKSCTEKKLFKGLLLPISEFNQIQAMVARKTGPSNSAIFTSKAFLTFSTSERIATRAMNKLKLNESSYLVKFIINKYQNRSPNFMMSTIEMGEFSGSEDEVLVLPFSQFQILNVDESIPEFKVVNLDYLDDFQAQIDDLMEGNNEAEKKEFISKATQFILQTEYCTLFKEKIDEEEVKLATSKLFEDEEPEEDEAALEEERKRIEEEEAKKKQEEEALRKKQEEEALKKKQEE
ncbi:MAG: hypothetical protein MJ252_27480, partial [archaeon]|nr:hypothetical protein [archaeon]